MRLFACVWEGAEQQQAFSGVGAGRGVKQRWGRKGEPGVF